MAPKQIDLYRILDQDNNGISAGLDEAGRGCLAGPVVAGAVILNQDIEIEGLADSKKLSAHARERLEKTIKKNALAWSIGIVWQRRIDAINILNASLEAMCLAARNLKLIPHQILLDGPQPIRCHIVNNFWTKSAPFPKQHAIIHGDSKIPEISAASIIAKTFRDRLMRKLAKRWPAYGFQIHKGYGTKRHREILAQLGPCPLHRYSFHGVK